MGVSTRAVITAVTAAFVAGAAVLGDPWLVGVVVAVAAVLAIGWPVLLNLPARDASAVVVLIGGAGGVLAVGLTPGEPVMRGLPEVVALAVLLTFVAELVRTDGRPRLVDSVSGGVSGVLVATAAAGWIAALRVPGGVSLVVTGALALVLAASVSAIPFDGWIHSALTVFAGTVGGFAAGTVMPGVDWMSGGVLGFAVGLLISVLHALVATVPALRRRRAAFAAAFLPVTVGGFAVYVVGRVLLG
jgi:hypothetical protein